MSDTKFWNPKELRAYLKLLRDAEDAHGEKMDLVRRRIESGYYLTDEIARATALKMLARAPDLRPPPPREMPPGPQRLIG